MLCDVFSAGVANQRSASRVACAEKAACLLPLPTAHWGYCQTYNDQTARCLSQARPQRAAMLRDDLSAGVAKQR
jgi:hypothetical protein